MNSVYPIIAFFPVKKWRFIKQFIVFVRLPAGGRRENGPAGPTSRRRVGRQPGRRVARADLLCFRLKRVIFGKKAGKARIFAFAAGKLVKEAVLMTG